MNTLQGASKVHHSFCGYIRSMCGLWGSKCPKVDKPVVFAYVGNPPFATLCGWPDAYSQQSAWVRGTARPSVFVIGLSRNITKIANSVVEFVSVDVVNAINRPISINIQPCNPMKAVLPSVKPCANISAGGIHASGNALGVCGLGPSGENTSVGVVVKKFADALCGKINLSHAVSPIKKWFGQKPGSVSALAGLRHFSTLEV